MQNKDTGYTKVTKMVCGDKSIIITLESTKRV